MIAIQNEHIIYPCGHQSVHPAAPLTLVSKSIVDDMADPVGPADPSGPCAGRSSLPLNILRVPVFGLASFACPSSSCSSSCFSLLLPSSDSIYLRDKRLFVCFFNANRIRRRSRYSAGLNDLKWHWAWQSPTRSKTACLGKWRRRSSR